VGARIGVSPSREPDLKLRGRLVRGLGSLGEMLPGPFVERKRSCGRCVGSAWNGEKALSASEYSALRAGILKASGSTDPMWVCSRAQKRSRRAPFMVLMSPPGYLSASLRPRSAASVSPGKIIVASTTICGQLPSAA